MLLRATDLMPIRIDVHSERASYPVLIGSGLTSQAAQLLRGEGLDGQAVVVSCGPVWKLQGKRLGGLARAKPAVLIADGERAKNLRTVSRLYDEFVRRGLD